MNTLNKIALVAGTFLASAPVALAVDYTMEATVSAAITDLLESLVTTIFGQIVVAVGLVGALFVTLHGINWLIGFFKRHIQ